MGCAFYTLLSNMFHAHINVENCHSIKSIKYICKYIAKGSDMTVFGLADEMQQMRRLNTNYGDLLASSIFKSMIHNCYSLSIHLENG